MKTLVGASIFDAGVFKNYLQSMISSHLDDPGNYDVNGLPLSGPVTNNFFVVQYPSNINFATETWVLSGTGKCSLQLSGAITNLQKTAGGANVTATGNSFNLNVSCNAAGVPWRVAFNIVPSSSASASTASSVIGQSNAQSTFAFVAGVGNHDGSLQNLVLCRLKDETSIANATKPDDLWDDDFVAKWTALKPSIWRPMGMTNPNGGNNSQYRYIPNWKTGLYLCTVHYVTSAYAGTSTGTNSYTFGNQPDYDGSGVYADGEMIHAKFVNASTTTGQTVAFGARAAVPLFTQFGANLSSGAIGANALATLTYDAVLGGFIYVGGGQSGTVPYELLAGFCNRIGADYWVNFSGQIDLPSVTQITTAVRNTLLPSLGADFEYGNEIWNFAGSFPYTTLAGNKAVKLGTPTDSNRTYNAWCGFRVRQIMELVTSAWAPRSMSQCNRILGFAAVYPPSSTDIYRMQGSDLGAAPWVSLAGGKDYSKSVANGGNGQPIEWVDAFCYATYHSGAQLMNFDAAYISQNSPTANQAVSSVSNTNPMVITTAGAHGLSGSYTYRVQLGRNRENSKGTNFTGPYAILNQLSVNATVVDATHISIPIDGSSLAAYSANAGSFQTYANQITDLKTAADNYASGNPTQMQAALDWVDSDLRAGTSYGNATAFASLSFYTTPGIISAASIYAGWDAIAAKYGKKVKLYEGGCEAWYPNVVSAGRLGIGAYSSAVSFNVGSSPSVSWASHGQPNGSRFAIDFVNSGGTLPGGVSTISLATNLPQYFIINATTNGFDLSNTVGGSAITLTGSPVGTVTAGASIYAGDTGRVAALLSAYKNDRRFYTLVMDQMKQFFALPTSDSWAWLLLSGGSQWATMVGDYYTSTFASWDAMRLNNNSQSRLFVKT
jgi:hypothetical protein